MIQEDKLNQLMSDPHYLEAIKWVFNEVVESNKPVIGKDDGDKLLGEKYRAYLTCKDFLEEGFKKIEGYKDNLQNNNGFDKSK